MSDFSYYQKVKTKKKRYEKLLYRRNIVTERQRVASCCFRSPTKTTQTQCTYMYKQHAYIIYENVKIRHDFGGTLHA